MGAAALALAARATNAGGGNECTSDSERSQAAAGTSSSTVSSAADAFVGISASAARAFDAQVCTRSMAHAVRAVLYHLSACPASPLLTWAAWMSPRMMCRRVARTSAGRQPASARMPASVAPRASSSCRHGEGSGEDRSPPPHRDPRSRCQRHARDRGAPTTALAPRGEGRLRACSGAALGFPGRRGGAPSQADREQEGPPPPEQGCRLQHQRWGPPRRRLGPPGLQQPRVWRRAPA